MRIFTRQHKRWLIGLLALILVVAAIYLRRARSGDAQSGSTSRRSATRPQEIPVVTAVTKTGDMKVYLNGLGSVVPYNTITVKSRVDGQLIKVLFQEGQAVSTGQLLAEIDPRPFEVQLAQAEGQMARDQALLVNAKLDLERYRVLFSQDSVPKQQLDTQESLVRQYEGVVKADQGQVDNAKLQLTYCHITAPISGRLGLRLVDVGNMVHAYDTNGLVVITQVQPIAVVFTLPEDNLPALLAKMKTGAKLPVEALDREQKNRLATGSLETIDNQIDPSTGTVKVKAVFANSDSELFPNQFVNARLLVDTLHDVTLVPNAAIQHSPQSAFVYVVKTDQTVEARNVEVKLTEGNETAIAKGLKPARDRRYRRRRQTSARHKGDCACVERDPGRELAVEPFATLHSSAGRNIAADGRRPARRRCGLQAVTRLGAAGGRLSDDPGPHVLSRRQPGRDGLVGHRAARAPVRPSAGPESDDLHQLRRQLGHHAAVRLSTSTSMSPNRKCRRRSTRHQPFCRGSAQSADLQQGQSGGCADSDAGAYVEDSAPLAKSKIWPTPGSRRKFRSSLASGWSASAADRSRRCAFKPIRRRCHPMA